jgi:hypothetical protein
MGLDLVLLAGGASLDVVRNPLVHLWPLVEFSDFLECFISSGVSGSGVIVEFLQNVSQELV